MLEAVVDGHRVRAVVNVQPHIVEVSYQGQRHVFTRPDVFADQRRRCRRRHDHRADARHRARRTGRAGPAWSRRARCSACMEAMKMELALKAPFAGTVTDVGAAAGAPGRARRDAVRQVEAERVNAPGEGHDLRGRPARRPAEREGDGAGRRQGGVRTPARRRRAAGRRGDQLRPPEVGAAARRRRGADDAARRSGSRPAGAGAQRARARPSPRARAEAHRDLRRRRPRPSPRRTSTAASTSSSRCSSRP